MKFDSATAGEVVPVHSSQFVAMPLSGRGEFAADRTVK